MRPRAAVRFASRRCFGLSSCATTLGSTFRVTADHKAYLIEANPNPPPALPGEFMKGVRAAGRTHPGTVLEIVELALARYRLPA